MSKQPGFFVEGIQDPKFLFERKVLFSDPFPFILFQVFSIFYHADKVQRNGPVIKCDSERSNVNMADLPLRPVC